MKVMIDPNLPQHRKVRKLATLLGTSPQAAIGHLVSLWCQVIQETENGNLADWDSADIATAAGWIGDHAVFTKALQTCKLLDRCGNGYEIHEWIEHQGDLIRVRELGRQRVKKYREKKQSTGDVTRDSCVTVTDVTLRNAPPILSSPILALPSPSIPEESHKNGSCVPVVAAAVVLNGLLDLWNNGREAKTWIRATPKRLKKVSSRLSDGFTVEQLRLVTTKLKESEWHTGGNDRGWRAPGPEWVLDTVERVEQWIAKDKPNPTNGQSGGTVDFFKKTRDANGPKKL